MQKKVLMFGWEFPPHNSGGLGVACYGLSKNLAKKGVRISFVLPKKIKGIESDFLKIIDPEFAYENSYQFNSILHPYITEKKYDSIFFKSKPVYGKTLFEEVLRYADFADIVAQKEDFDIIHAHDWLSFGAGIRAKERSGKPFIAHIHATEFDRGGGEGVNSLVYSLEKEGMEKADKVIAVSYFTKEIILKHYGINPQKVEVVHNGIDFSKEEDVSRNVHQIKKAGKKVVLFVGRLTLQKGPDYFIKAAKRVCDFSKDTYFIISGSGDMENYLIEEVARMGISDKVFFTGFLRGEKLKEVYRLADLFVMPSVSEPFGITPLESLINGTPVLMSRQSGVSEVVSHALKVDFWDVEGISDKILAVLNYDALSCCLKEHGKKEVKKISWESAAEKCIKIYKST